MISTEVARSLVGATVLGLAVGIVVGLFLAEIPNGNREVAMIVLGAAVAWAGNVVSFHFGTSEGSKTKTSLMSQKEEK